MAARMNLVFTGKFQFSFTWLFAWFALADKSCQNGNTTIESIVKRNVCRFIRFSGREQAAGLAEH